MDLFWDEFLIEGNELFEYMITNFENMFQNNSIKHFTIRDGIYGYSSDTNKIREKYGTKIEKELIPWIRKEYEEQRLFQRDDWKPFRDQFDFSSMYYAYRKLFQYKTYYFQFIVESICKIKFCKHCKNNNSTIHFGLAVYGWKDDNSEILKPSGKIKILANNLMPESDWIYQ